MAQPASVADTADMPLPEPEPEPADSAVEEQATLQAQKQAAIKEVEDNPSFDML